MGRKILDKMKVFHKVSFYMERYNLSVSNAIRKLMDEGEIKAHFNAIKSSFYAGRREYLKTKINEELISEETISEGNNIFIKYWNKAKNYLIDSFKEFIS